MDKDFSFTVRDLPKPERPRERLQKIGAENLSAQELLALVIGRGIQSRAHFFQTEIKTYCRNLKFVEVPITYRAASPRLGASSLKEAFQQLWRLFQLRLKEQL